MDNVDSDSVVIGDVSNSLQARDHGSSSKQKIKYKTV